MPSTPEFISIPQSLDSNNLMRKTHKVFSNNMIQLKQNNIKSIDDKINNIMSKHIKNEEKNEFKMPLAAKNFNIEQ